jgi:hypothetical protein
MSQNRQLSEREGGGGEGGREKLEEKEEGGF